MVLTGASRGIGHATVKLFSSGLANHHLLAPAVRQRTLPLGCRAADHVEVDLGDHRAMPRALAEIKTRLDGLPIHALINNAGFSPKNAEGGRLTSLTTPVETWMNVFHVNFLAPILASPGPVRRTEGWGRYGRQRNVDCRLACAPVCRYRVCDLEGCPCLSHPGDGARLRTPRHPGERDSAGRNQDRYPVTGDRSAACPAIPMGRIGLPDEVAKVIYFLCSDAASYVTGEEIKINGGTTRLSCRAGRTARLMRPLL